MSFVLSFAEQHCVIFCCTLLSKIVSFVLSFIEQHCVICFVFIEQHCVIFCLLLSNIVSFLSFIEQHCVIFCCLLLSNIVPFFVVFY